jgi:hypothetical protein
VFEAQCVFARVWNIINGSVCGRALSHFREEERKKKEKKKVFFNELKEQKV